MKINVKNSELFNQFQERKKKRHGIVVQTLVMSRTYLRRYKKRMEHDGKLQPELDLFRTKNLHKMYQTDYLL